MKEIKRIRQALLDQRAGGSNPAKAATTWRTRPTGPNPGVGLPSTPTGARWMPNLIAQLRRSGFVWPWPPK